MVGMGVEGMDSKVGVAAVVVVVRAGARVARWQRQLLWW
jgi:hypothetical protein